MKAFISTKGATHMVTLAEIPNQGSSQTRPLLPSWPSAPTTGKPSCWNSRMR